MDCLKLILWLKENSKSRIQILPDLSCARYSYHFNIQYPAAYQKWPNLMKTPPTELLMTSSVKFVPTICKSYLSCGKFHKKGLAIRFNKEFFFKIRVSKNIYSRLQLCVSILDGESPFTELTVAI